MHNPDPLPTHFQILRRVFVSRLVDIELLASSGDTTKLAGQFFALFASISLAITLPLLLIGGLAQQDIWAMQHFLIATAMAFTGLFGIICWESIFPERKDLLILGPLPIRRSTLFFAKFSALASALALGLIALNAFTGIGWALFFEPTGGGLLGLIRSFAAYWITIFFAGGFVFSCVLIAHGVTSLLLPRKLFLRVSGIVQTAGVIAVFAIYILEPSLEAIPALTAPSNHCLLQLLPSYWFLALYQQLNGSMHDAFTPLVPLAFRGLTASAAGAIFAVLIAYARILPRIVDEPDIQPSTHRWISQLLNRRGSLNPVILAFTWRTLLRSRQHRVIYGFLQGAAFTLMLVYLRSPALTQTSGKGLGAVTPGCLTGTLIMTCISVLAARIIIGLPIELKSNWIFQLTHTHASRDYRSAVRLALFTIAVAPVLIASMTISLWIRGGWSAAIHITALVLLTGSLVEAACFRLRKIPFTCSWMPGKANVLVIFFGFFFAIPLSLTAGYHEFHLLESKAGRTWLLIALAALALALRLATQAFAQPTSQWDFEEHEEPQFLNLNLE